jgi:type IV pilus assembly protein PilA
MSRRLSAVRFGLTLIELVVVVAILGVLAAMLLPKFEGLQSSANHVASASSASDVARLISTYKTSKMVYPDGWDSLTDGTALWTPGNVATVTKGLHAQLSDGSNAKLTTASLTATQAKAFRDAGIVNLFNVNTTSSLRPGDMFITPAPISGTASVTVAVVNSASSGGKKIIDHVYRQNQQTGGTSGSLWDSTGAIDTAGNVKLVVFGLGPQSKMIPNSMMEAPTYGNVNAQYIYNRLLAVFEINEKNRITLKAVLGADGDLLDDMSVHLHNSAL